MASNGNQKSIPPSSPVWERRKRKRNSPDLMRDEEEEQRASKSTRSSVTLDDDHIFKQILLRLPAKCLLKFRLVSKHWFQFITDKIINKPPLLIMRTSNAYPLCQLRLDGGGHDLQQQLKQQQQLRQKEEKIWTRFNRFWGSCNGLLCIELSRTGKRTNSESIIWLWNPWTKEFKELACPPIFRGWPTETFGFGYDIKSQDYKLIRNLSYDEDNHQRFLHTEVQVFSLGTNSWKFIPNCLYQIIGQRIGVYVNGGEGVYWLAKKESRRMIICFDVANEDYKEIANTPPSVQINTVKLAELKGFLCIMNPKIEEKCLDVWVMNNMEKEYSWSKLFTIREPGIVGLSEKFQVSFELLGSCKKNGDDEIVVLIDKKGLFLYNLKNEKSRVLIQMENVDKFRVVRSCIDSAVSLNTGTYISTIF